MKDYYVYILSNASKKYNLTKLVHFETTTDIREAIYREKQLKGWLRSKKMRLIE